MSDEHLVRSNYDSPVQINVTPENAKWDYLGYTVMTLADGEEHRIDTAGIEVALVPLSGSALLTVGEQGFRVSRKSVWEEMPHVLYVPPGQEIVVLASSDFEFAYGSAPAEGKYPVRLFTPAEQQVVVRGGGAATRQVNFTLQHPMPAERLILFEVYVSGGMYSGWPPHCHDGFAGSPYLEETYYYKINPKKDGYAIHRNYRIDNDFDEVFVCKDGDCVLVTEGFHPVAVPPGSQVYFLNYLAGELLDEDRAKPPYDDPAWGPMKDNFEANKLTYPVVQP
ncbi:MAG: 5-deoxy-glucuronate isomerase [Candidatus Promineifilaceae bacterium]